MTTIEPGAVATKFSENAKFGELPAVLDGLDEPTLNLIQKFQVMMTGNFIAMTQQGDDIAKVILEAITSTNPHARYMTNPNYEELFLQRYKELTGDDFRKVLGDFCFGEKKE